MIEKRTGEAIALAAAFGMAAVGGVKVAQAEGEQEAFELPPHVSVVLPGVVCSAPTEAQRAEALDAIGLMDEKPLTLVGENLTRGAGGLDIQYQLSQEVINTPGWVDALEEAAQVWEAVIDDPVTVTFGVDFTSGQGFLAATSTSRFASTYSAARSAMTSDAAAFESDYLNALPSSDAPFITTQGTQNSGALGGIALSNPNRQALGFSSALSPGEADGSIVFNTDFSFDTDPSDGLTGVDVIFVMVHELGHALGFISGVDVFSDPSQVWVPHILDLFRGGIVGRFNDWDNFAEFGAFEREFRPGIDCALDTFDAIDFDAFRFSTGANNGDGRQASHWKDDSLLGIPEVIGVMDPTFSQSQNPPGLIKDADLLAFSLIGWDIDLIQTLPCPEDVNGDGVVGPTDLSLLLGNWGQGGAADVDGSGIVGPTDLAVLLGGWGPCP